MVVFHVKRGDRSEFLFEASVSTSNGELIRSLCRLQNLRLRLAALAEALEGLGRYGVAKPRKSRGWTRTKRAPPPSNAASSTRQTRWATARAKA